MGGGWKARCVRRQHRPLTTKAARSRSWLYDNQLTGKVPEEMKAHLRAMGSRYVCVCVARGPCLPAAGAQPRSVVVVRWG